MKLVSFIRHGDSMVRLGAVLRNGTALVDLQAAAALRGIPTESLCDMLSFLDGGEAARDAAEQSVEAAERGSADDAILSWDDVEQSLAEPFEGYNVVWHEFAHQLDSEDGSTNGAPAMRLEHLHRWAEVFSREYAALQEAERRGEPTVLDAYGTESPAEFFAVATETFFSDPASLQHYHPQLYEELRQYYGSDPLRWLEGVAVDSVT